MALILLGAAQAMADVSVLTFGAACDGTTDDISAFEAALAQGGVVTVPKGTCRLSRPLNINTQVILRGEGGSGTPGSILLFDSGSAGIIVNRYNTTPDGGTDGADWSTIETIGIHWEMPTSHAMRHKTYRAHTDHLVPMLAPCLLPAIQKRINQQAASLTPQWL